MSVANKDVMVVWAGFTVSVTSPDVPPPVKPFPAVTESISPVPPPEAAIVIPPSELVMVILDPAVRVAAAGPFVPPISN